MSDAAANRSSNPPTSGAIISREQMTPYQRWEIPSFDQFPPSGKKGTQAAAQADLQDIQQQAHSAGFASGHAAGYAEGIRQAQAEAAQMHALLQSLQESLNQVDQQVAQSLLDLALAVARKLVGETLQAKPEVVLEIVREAISSLPHFNQNAHLILHPLDADLVREHMGEQLGHAGWKIFTDHQMQRGGCRVETAHSHIDATNEARWQRVVESIGQDKSWQT